MSDWAIVARKRTIGAGGWSVWIDEQGRTADDPPHKSATIVGYGLTRKAALLCARDELRSLETDIVAALLDAEAVG